ncbi:MAG: nucleotidyl transferase AbiEii/AbiGii toxin family protein [Defluviitaleaceae bacterium]|nr:nucleotidyl transferase AbiEii/AbiGii toxin family protein [Defluviitaleaceae bacterium]
MRFTNAAQLKDWIKNKSKQTGTPANVLLQTYMMERLLERVSISSYRDNLILKGGFLIAAMVGIDRRTTMDMDTTVKGLPVSREGIVNILSEIIALDADDSVIFEMLGIKNIRDISDYDDYRVSLRAVFHTVRVNMKIDITTGDTIIPVEIEYHYRLMFGERTIPVMAYNLYTILAEKIETILSRNVTNTRGRDFYDVYILLSANKDIISRKDMIHALRVKAEERGSVKYIDNHSNHLQNISDSPEIAKIWAGYVKSYPYAKGIALQDILELILWVFMVCDD